ncbi:Uncharacterized protein APZ42_023558 [Daphnia magna]|uniref:Uncharacterized protein n=1 Tax=Daphnia magna TaxID=35525 RepID=A0A0P6AKM1_9CRUS|nr:Uncharacterized protein APZ42_023558 [Daphnia magna]
MDLTFFEYVIYGLLQPESMLRVYVLIFCIFLGKFIRDMLYAIFPTPGRISVNEDHTGPNLRTDEASASKKEHAADEWKSEVITVTKNRCGPELKPDVSLRNYELAQEKLKYYKMDLAWTNRALTKARKELQACADMGIEPRLQIPSKDIAEKTVKDKVMNDGKISIDPVDFVGNDEILTELDKTPIGSTFFEPSKNRENPLARASNAEVRTAQLNGKVVVPINSPTQSGQFVRVELNEQERADYMTKIKRLERERDAARSKLRAIDEKCETALLLTTQSKNKYAGVDAALAKKWAENELRKKTKARLRAVKNAKLNKPDLSRMAKNSEDDIVPSTTESRKFIPMPVSKQVRILINEIPVNMAIDTRCRFSCINKSLWQELGEPELLPISFDEWSGNQVARRGLIEVLRGRRIKYKLEWKDVMGYFIARAKINKKDHRCPLLVFDKPEIPNFIGKSWFQTLELAGVKAFQIRRPKEFSKKEHNIPKDKLTSSKKKTGPFAKRNFLRN